MNEANPLVSIVIPARDRRALLAEALASVRAQTYPHWEALVCDDGSTDESQDLVIELGRVDERIRLLPPIGAAGACARRNQGSAAARGTFVLFLDSDDQLAPHCLAQRVAAMRDHPQLGFAVFPCRVFRHEPQDTPLLWNADTGESDIDRYLRKDIPWQTASIVWRRDALARVGPWDESALSGQDWEFHLRALIQGVAYKRFRNDDCYWRLPEPARESIGNRSNSPEHLRYRVVMIERVFEWLRQADELTERRRNLLVGQFFFVASGLSAKGERREATRVWWRCRRLGLIGTQPYLEGVAYLRLWRCKGLRIRMHARFERTWPPGWIYRRSETHLNTPLPSAVQIPQLDILAPAGSVDLATHAPIGKTVGPSPEVNPGPSRPASQSDRMRRYDRLCVVTM